MRVPCLEALRQILVADMQGCPCITLADAKSGVGSQPHQYEKQLHLHNWTMID